MTRMKTAEENICVHMKPGDVEGTWKEWETKGQGKGDSSEAIPFPAFLAVGNMFSLKLEL